jgi:hypothetical protein
MNIEVGKGSRRDIGNSMSNLKLLPPALYVDTASRYAYLMLYSSRSCLIASSTKRSSLSTRSRTIAMAQHTYKLTYFDVRWVSQHIMSCGIS